MSYPLRHSHIAIRETLLVLAKAAHARIESGEDDIGTFHFFDMTVREGTASQTVRFASHEGDAMVHLLAEQSDDLAALVVALRQVGVDQNSDLSISRDQYGSFLRDLDILRAQLANQTFAAEQSSAIIGAAR